MSKDCECIIDYGYKYKCPETKQDVNVKESEVKKDVAKPLEVTSLPKPPQENESSTVKCDIKDTVLACTLSPEAYVEYYPPHSGDHLYDVLPLVQRDIRADYMINKMRLECNEDLRKTWVRYNRELPDSAKHQVQRNDDKHLRFKNYYCQYVEPVPMYMHRRKFRAEPTVDEHGNRMPAPVSSFEKLQNQQSAKKLPPRIKPEDCKQCWDKNLNSICTCENSATCKICRRDAIVTKH